MARFSRRGRFGHQLAARRVYNGDFVYQGVAFHNRKPGRKGASSAGYQLTCGHSGVSLITAEIGIAVACNSVQPYSAGVFLDIDTWKAEFDAWWTGWQEELDASDREDDEESEVVPEDTFIPAAKPAPPDLSYRQPDRPPFQIGSSDVPAELLRPIIDFLVGMHERDWPRMASASPNFDRSPAEQASQLVTQYLGDDYGRWIYIRQIDSWWCEENRACVVVRGIEHLAPDEEEPATNQETVVTYDLRRHRNSWVIVTWSQGWPRYGSAPKLSGTPAWMKGWELAD